MKKLLLLFGIFISANSLILAQKGDEDASMLNSVKVRDQKAIDEAVNGWWTASMKTHDERISWWKRSPVRHVCPIGASILYLAVNGREKKWAVMPSI